MPPTFLYLLFVAVWVALACAVWAISVALLLIPKTRRFSGPLSLAMAGTFPFVLAYQVLAVPVVATVLLCGRVIWKTLEPGTSTVTKNPVVITVSILIALIAFGTILVMSLAGFYDGWISGWRCGQGMELREAINEAPAYRYTKKRIRAMRSKRHAAGA